LQSVQEVRPYCRRLSSRFEAPDGVWVYWRCDGRDDVSRVCDLSAGGLYLETQNPRPAGVKLKMDFLVQEGQIRAEAIVRRADDPNGLGLKFTAITEEDCPRLIALLTRVRGYRTPAITRNNEDR
jgi:hypothetical protein